jgi:type I restriction enzyme S subunit
MKIDTSNWDKVTLGDVAQSLTTATKDPLSEGFERYVGLEHIEPGNIHIKSWGNVADGTTFTRVFSKGQVLFGKRRAYQKKAAMAEFDGICSGDILVCEAIKDAVLPELLPFIVQSDRFFEHAIKTSAGSLSPRTKFKDLAKFSFKLPTKSPDQKRIADLLWSIDMAKEHYLNVAKYLSKVEGTFLQTFLQSQSRLKRKELREAAAIITKGTTPTTAGFKFLEQGINFIKAESISEDNAFLPDKFGYISKECHESFRRSQLEEKDILFSIAGVIGRCTLVSKDILPANINQALAVIRLADQGIDHQYLMLFLTSQYVMNHFKRVAVKTAQVNVSLEQIGDLEIPMLDLPIQRELVSKMKRIKNMQNRIHGSMSQVESIEKSIINQIFG